MLVRASAVGASTNDYTVVIRYNSTITEAVSVSSTTTELTILLRDAQTTSEMVLNQLQNSVGATAFRSLFEVQLTAEGQARLYEESIWQAYGTSIGGELMALGDLDYDGADDFALVRTREDAGDAVGGVLVYKLSLIHI